MSIDFNAILTVVVSNWPFFFASCIMFAIMEQIKKYAPDATSGPLWKLIRRTLPVQPILIGLFLGFAPGIPLPVTMNSVGSLAGPLYYAGAGVFSTWLKDIVQTWLKHKMPEAE